MKIEQKIHIYPLMIWRLKAKKKRERWIATRLYLPLPLSVFFWVVAEVNYLKVDVTVVVATLAR